MGCERTSWRVGGVVLLALAVLCLTGSQVLATSSVLSTWQSTYPSSTLATTYSCTLCHTSPPDLNPYGGAVFSAGGSSTGMKSIESLDSDGDGFTNLQEIAANTLPGDATSHPTPAAPTASFSGAPMSGTLPLNVSFSDSSSGVPTSWSWAFGDGATSTAQNPAHVYTKAGVYSVTLTVGNSLGNSAITKPGSVLVTFTDVPLTYWALHQVLACVSAGIVKGYADGSYQPRGQVTRDQMAVFVARAVAGGESKVPVFSGTPTFSDVPVGSWALNHIEFCRSQNIVKGVDPTHYVPLGLVNRGQMAAFVARAISPPDQRPDLTSYAPPTTPSFTDVAVDFSFYRFIEYCSQSGVVTGYLQPDGTHTYRPADPVTRDQMAVYIQRAFALPM